MDTYNYVLASGKFCHLLSADNFCKQFGSRLEPTECHKVCSDLDPNSPERIFQQIATKA